MVIFCVLVDLCLEVVRGGSLEPAGHEVPTPRGHRLLFLGWFDQE